MQGVKVKSCRDQSTVLRKYSKKVLVLRHQALTIMAFSSMLLGGTVRPPYWNVFFRFCSHALAMPVKRKHYILLALLKCTAGLLLCVCVCVCVSYPDIVPRRCERPAAGVWAGKAWGLQSSDGKQSGCTAASSLADNYHCTTHTHTHTHTDSGLLCVGLWCVCLLMC